MTCHNHGGSVGKPSQGRIGPISWILIGLLGVYKAAISPLLGPRCRFIPSCSEYAGECLRRYGLLRALAKTAWRLLRCQPLSKGGYDPP